MNKIQGVLDDVDDSGAQEVTQDFMNKIQRATATQAWRAEIWSPAHLQMLDIMVQACDLSSGVWRQEDPWGSQTS